MDKNVKASKKSSSAKKSTKKVAGAVATTKKAAVAKKVAVKKVVVPTEVVETNVEAVKEVEKTPTVTRLTLSEKNFTNAPFRLTESTEGKRDCVVAYFTAYSEALSYAKDMAEDKHVELVDLVKLPDSRSVKLILSEKKCTNAPFRLTEVGKSNRDHVVAYFTNHESAVKFAMARAEEDRAEFTDLTA